MGPTSLRKTRRPSRGSSPDTSRTASLLMEWRPCTSRPTRPSVPTLHPRPSPTRPWPRRGGTPRSLPWLRGRPRLPRQRRSSLPSLKPRRIKVAVPLILLGEIKLHKCKKKKKKKKIQKKKKKKKKKKKS